MYMRVHPSCTHTYFTNGTMSYIFVCLLCAGMDQEGIYRVNGNAKAIEKLKASFDKGQYTVCCTLYAVQNVQLASFPGPRARFTLVQLWAWYFFSRA